MKSSSAQAPPPIIDRKTALGCLCANLLVLPGLGSLTAGKRSGYWQIALALLGFVSTSLFATWFVYALIQLEPIPSSWPQWQSVMIEWKPRLILGAFGFGTFTLAWLWALQCSLQILKSTRPSPNPKDQLKG